MPTVLIVDDCPTTRRSIAHIFTSSNIKVQEAGSCLQCVQSIQEHHPDVVILDLMLPDATGMEAFKRIQEVDMRLPVILITATRSSEMVIEALKLGAIDFLVKPIAREMVLRLVSSAIESRRLMQIPVDLGAEIVSSGSDELATDPMVGSSAGMQEVYKAIGRVARQNMTVLVRGESGTGKELVARAVYQHSHRSNRTFIAINCSAIPESLLESEMFGHEKGAFTGAESQRIGKFEQCHEGTLFLDEIGDMTPLTQCKLLRVLQEKRFQRVGGDKEIPADVRIIAATSRDLESMVDRNEFRLDLYYRLSVVQIKLPPLRQRSDDLPHLVLHFMKLYARELGCEFQSITSEALKILCEYSWPGNVRELQSTIKWMLLRSPGPTIHSDILPESIRESRVDDAREVPEIPILDQFIRQRLDAGANTVYVDAIHLVERSMLSQVLRHTGGNQSVAAEVLGITRSTLRSKLRVLGISTATAVIESPNYLENLIRHSNRTNQHVRAGNGLDN